MLQRHVIDHILSTGLRKTQGRNFQETSFIFEGGSVGYTK